MNSGQIFRIGLYDFLAAQGWREWQTILVFLPWEPHEQYENAKKDHQRSPYIAFYQSWHNHILNMKI